MQGEGRAAIAGKDLMLGQHLPPLTLLCKDSHGNAVDMPDVPDGLTLTLKAAAPPSAPAEVAWEAPEMDVAVFADQVRSLHMFSMLFYSASACCSSVSQHLLHT